MQTEYRSVMGPKSLRAVKYEVGAVSRPPKDYAPFLFVFESLRAARKFRGGRPSTKIMIGVAVRPRKRDKWPNGGTITGDAFWDGTVFCDSFLPLEVTKL
jgi:hypothetical protein